MTETTIKISSNFKEVIKIILMLATVIGLLGSIVWFIVQPIFDGYLDNRNKIFIHRLDELQSTVKEIKDSLGKNKTPFIEFLGGGLVPDKTAKAGKTVTVIYTLRRNLPCTTTVQVRFISAKTSRIDSSLTSVIPSTQAAVTIGFQTFSINVRLPTDMEPGRWAYAPLLIPENCNGQKQTLAPLSDFFEVVKP